MDQEKNRLLVSIILPVYNTADYLNECIESILTQSFSDFELIIVDDASYDGSAHIIEHYRMRDSRIRFLRNATNRWIGFTRNRGLALALGKYIANFDSDDIAFPKWIETQLLFLENNPTIDIVGANLMFIDRYGKKLFEKNHFPQYDQDIKKMIPLVCPIANNTVLIRKKCFDELGVYRSSAEVAEDYDLWMRFRKKYVFHNTQKCLVYYRVHGKNSIVRERKRIMRETMTDFWSKAKELFPPSFLIVRFIVLSLLSYSLVFIRIKFR